MNTQSLQSGSTYYYSSFKLFEPSIINDMLYCQAIRQQLKLPEYWNKLAQNSFIQKNQEKQQSISIKFIQDMFLYSWIYCKDDFSKFSSTLQLKFKKFCYDEDLFEELKSIFFVYVNDFDGQFVENPKLRFHQEGVLQPLVVVNYPQKNDIDNIIHGIGNINLDRCKSDLEYRLSNAKIVKLEKQQRKLENLNRAINNIQMNQNQENWTVVKQFVMLICDAETKEQMRILQPSSKFYECFLLLWMLEKSGSPQKVRKMKQLNFQMNFNLFSVKAKYFFGSDWKDSYLLPLHLIFQLTENILMNVMQKNPHLAKEDILMELLNQISEELNNKWNQQILETIKRLQ